MAMRFLVCVLSLSFLVGSSHAIANTNSSTDWKWLLGCYSITSGEDHPQPGDMAVFQAKKSEFLLHSDKTPFDAIVVTTPFHYLNFTAEDFDVILDQVKWIDSNTFEISYSGEVYDRGLDRVVDANVSLKIVKKSDTEFDATWVNNEGTEMFWELGLKRIQCPN